VKVNAYWLPPGCRVELMVHEVQVERCGQQLTICMPRPTAEQVVAIADYLRTQQERVLQKRSVIEIVETLDRVAELWLDEQYPWRQRACDAISVVSGFSREMVGHAIELEQLSSRRNDMISALTRELGDHQALDHFITTPKGSSMAVGPGLIGGIFSANIPALPHLTVMRSFLVKSACLGRVSKNEPVYLSLYAESLAQVDEELASCLAVLHWEHNDQSVESAFLNAIDHLIAYGSDRSLALLKERCPPRLTATWHGHRMGFAYIPKAALSGSVDALAEQIAYDFSLFEQHACLSPQACFVEEGGEVTPKQFAQSLARAMDKWLERLPARQLAPEEAALLRQQHDAILMAQTLGKRPGEYITPPTRLQGAVVLEPAGPFEPCPLDRFARVIAIAGPAQLLELLEPCSHYLQCAAVAEPTDSAVLSALARLGVTRLCPPGRMGTPSMVWAHDGRSCLAELLRWCDYETLPPGH
jgi:hypothetical protein